MSRWKLGSKVSFNELFHLLTNVVYFGYGPLPVTVTTRIITFLVGNPFKSLFDTVAPFTSTGSLYPIKTNHWSQSHFRPGTNPSAAQGILCFFVFEIMVRTLGELVCFMIRGGIDEFTLSGMAYKQGVGRYIIIYM